MFVFVTILAIALALLELWMRNQPAHRVAWQLPGPQIYPLIGNIPDTLGLSRDNGLSYFRKKAADYGRAYRFYALGYLHYWPIRCHELEFLMNDPVHSGKSFFYGFLKGWLNCGLLCSKGTKWANRRKILTPAFHFNILQKFLLTFKEECTTFIEHICREDATNGKGVAIDELIAQFTLNNICETAMGVKLSRSTESDQYRRKINETGDLLTKRYMNPVLYSDSVFSWTTLSKEIAKCVRVLHDFSGSVIGLRRKEYRNRGQITGQDDDNIYTKRRYAMLDTLLEAETAGQIDEAGIQEEVDTFMFEGYDTTSSGLNFCFYTIGTYQAAQQKIYDEIMDIVDEYNGDASKLTVQDYSRMPYMDLVIKETLRLFPPVPMISRGLSDPVDVGDGVRLPAGTQVHLFIYNVHRDPGQFPDPERFEPERFLPEHSERRHPYAYIPFSAGTRNCIGQKYAMLEIKALLVAMLLEFSWETITKAEELDLIMDFVLRTKKPIRVRFSKRNK